MQLVTVSTHSYMNLHNVKTAAFLIVQQLTHIEIWGSSNIVHMDLRSYDTTGHRCKMLLCFQT